MMIKIKEFGKWLIRPPSHISNGYWLIFILVFLDQISKTIMVNFVPPRGFYVEILPIFNFVLSENYGAGFGFLAGYGGAANLFFILMTLAITITLLWLIKQNPSDNLSLTQNTTLPIMFVIGGALGNLCDRVWRGSVIDFLDFHIGNFHWPTFNLADSFITIGAGLWLVHEWRLSKIKKS